ncbi:ubiquinone biosynthesis accessory factor UbiJ [Vibrio vulnificus]|uniref:ubiquinone biosynthesis accessory factor UbiJ n=1 Tax=Vibrio TaxID=662 RepID=UPI0001F5B9FF|nr:MULTISPECIES: SCP2 domain-containing protein [Vibrio]OJI55722.1 SCP-2 sterol transfer family protein [Vibrio fluvialis]ADV87925.1 protein YigP () clustered with ubiquinone biosynthetic genes [Vibrio vulnificus MO6-24/O]AUJ33814.1 SCP2 domain-containing protein [Vibrio vulnificus]EGQ9882971.1 SCP2 domain-containing protein [Vibrio vulnificus]EGR0037764.1 SCP2 domain-containing protein [Vibrio vulnificus]
MPFEPLITAVIETSLNVLVKDNPDLEKRLLRLKGQVIQVHLQELNKTLTFIFSQQIDVLANYEGQPDCYLSLKLAVLPELREQANITKLIKQDKLILEGDIQLAQKFAQLITDAKPDVEEWVSRVTGDVVAHSLAQGVKNVGGFVGRQAKKQQHHLAQVITEEWRLAPGPLEVAYFCDQVDDAKSDLARLEARLQKLLEKA